MEKAMTLLDIFIIFYRRKKLILSFMLLFCIVALFYLFFFAPKIYRAECRVLPPSQSGSLASAMLAQMGGLANLVTGVSPTNGELLIGVLRGQTVVDKIIDQFDLMEVYKEKYRLKMREKLTSDILRANEDIRSGIVTIAILDEDPFRAAAMANAFVEELKKAMQSLAIGEAAQRRIFFEQQAEQAHAMLSEAEDELQEFQEASGVIAVEPQVEALIASIAQLRAEITAKEVEISSLRTYASTNNPALRRSQSELTALRAKLAKLEQQGQGAERKSNLSALREAPQLGLEYQRKLRDAKFAATMYDLMLRQYEVAKMDEAREAVYVQIVDAASPPDYKFKPKYAQSIILSLLLGLCMGMLWTIFANYFDMLKEDPQQRQILNSIKLPFIQRK